VSSVERLSKQKRKVWDLFWNHFPDKADILCEERTKDIGFIGAINLIFLLFLKVWGYLFSKTFRIFDF
jgi:hypothetical protein